MEFKVLSRDELKTFETSKKWIVISIFDPEGEALDIYKDNPPEGILYMRFPDLDVAHAGYEYAYLLFDEYNAKDILRFVRYHEKNIDLVVCQCEAGISRSAGVAGALSKIYNNDDSYIFKSYLPNRRVYSKILEAYYK